MKHLFLFTLLSIIFTSGIHAQNATVKDQSTKDIYALVDKYVQARDNKDAVLLESILTTDIDQLVSSGKWRNGKKESMDGMMQSSQNNPGSRKITVEKVRFLSATSAIADARYVIQNADGSARKMWSTFVVVNDQDSWKISAIRNMLPTGQQ